MSTNKSAIECLKPPRQFLSPDGGQDRTVATFCVKGKGWTGKYPCPAYSFCSQFSFGPDLGQEFGSACE